MTELFGVITILLIVKVMLATLLFVYVVFAMLMMRQIVAMTRAVAMQDDFIIRIIGILHFVMALIVWIISLFLQTR